MKLRDNRHTGRLLGKRMYHFSCVDSTNRIAFSLAEKGEGEGTVVLADRQLKGEGRRGSVWFSPPGGLWFSLILRPSCCSPERSSLYSLVGAIAAIRAIREFSSCGAYIKHPNDVMIAGRKVGGTMCKIKMEQGKVKFAILGMGINLNIKNFPVYLRGSVTSLLLETHRSVHLPRFLDWVLCELESLYLFSQTSPSMVKDKIKQFTIL